MSFMTGMIAIDTNIWVYALVDPDPSRRERAARLVGSIARSEGVMPWQVLVEFGAVLSRRTRAGLAHAEAAEAITRVGEVFPVVVPGPGCVRRALEMQQADGVSYWDALLISACAEIGVRTLYSEDAQSRDAIAGVKIVNPLR